MTGLHLATTTTVFRTQTNGGAASQHQDKLEAAERDNRKQTTIVLYVLNHEPKSPQPRLQKPPVKLEKFIAHTVIV